jgi:hypothetical protein
LAENPAELTTDIDLFVFYELAFENSNDSEQSFENFVKITDSILYISTSEEVFFKGCILNRINKSQIYSTEWPYLKAKSTELFKIIEKCGKESTLVCIDNDYIDQGKLSICSNLESIIKPVYDFLLSQINPRDTNYFIDLKSTKYRLQKDMRRNNADVSVITKNNKRVYFSVLEHFENDWMSKYNNCKSQLEKYELIDNFIDKYNCREILYDEEKAVLKNVLTSNEVSLSSVMINEAIVMCNSLKDESFDYIFSQEELEKQFNDSQDDKIIIRMHFITDFLDDIGRHPIFKHRIFNDKNFISLLHAMLKSANYLVKIYSSKLISLLLECDHKKYGALIAQHGAKISNEKSISRLLFDVIYDVCSLLFEKLDVIDDETDDDSDNCTDDDTYNDFSEIRRQVINLVRNKLNFNSLALIFKGHYETCSQLTTTDVKNLVRLTINIKDPRIKSRLYSILNMIFKYGSIDIWRNSINVIEILTSLFGFIKEQIRINSYDIIWHRALTFFQDILCFLQKESNSDSILPCIDQEMIKSLDELFQRHIIQMNA